MRLAGTLLLSAVFALNALDVSLLGQASPDRKCCCKSVQTCQCQHVNGKCRGGICPLKKNESEQVKPKTHTKPSCHLKRLSHKENKKVRADNRHQHNLNLSNRQRLPSGTEPVPMLSPLHCGSRAGQASLPTHSKEYYLLHILDDLPLRQLQFLKLGTTFDFSFLFDRRFDKPPRITSLLF